MNTLKERIDAEYKTAFKAGERLKIDVLRLIKADVQRVEIDKKSDAVADADLVQILNRQAKQRQEMIDAATKGGRAEMAAQAEQELTIIKSYLPKSLSTEELTALINEAVTAVGTNQGLVMKHVMGKAAGAADGKLVSQLVSARLKPAG